MKQQVLFPCYNQVEEIYMNLEGKVAIVTGSTRGIGNAIAKLYLKSGAKVAICGSKEENAITAMEKIKEELKIENDQIMPIGVNMKDTQSIQIMVKKVIEKWQRIDILVNNAGITSNKSLLDSTDEDFYEMFDINVFGTLKTTREVVKYMKETGGSIINTSSMVGINGGKNQVAYASSKFAINGITKSLAKELGQYNIRVNAVAPGVVETDMMKDTVTEEMKQMLIHMTPLAKMAEPKDLAGAYLYLASNESCFTTGTIIQVDGGLVM